MGPRPLPLKFKLSKIGLRHVLSWPKLGLEPKCHDPVTFGGYGKPRMIFNYLLQTVPDEVYHI